jgi:catechol 2,3-dioxygenase-like lactoylglutathione lyase family enzyme
VSTVHEVALFTNDVETALRFYSLLLGTNPVSTWPGGALFAAGDVKILVHDRGAGMDDGPPNEDHVAIAVGDLDGHCDELRSAGHSLLVEPRSYPWGRSAYLRDPDGRLVELTQQ